MVRLALPLGSSRQCIVDGIVYQACHSTGACICKRQQQALVFLSAGECMPLEPA